MAPPITAVHALLDPWTMPSHMHGGYRSSSPPRAHWEHTAPAPTPAPTFQVPLMSSFAVHTAAYPGQSYAMPLPTPLPAMASVNLVGHHSRPVQRERRYALLEERYVLGTRPQAPAPRARSQPAFRPANPFDDVPPAQALSSMGSFASSSAIPTSSQYPHFVSPAPHRPWELNIISPPVISDPEVLEQGGAHKSGNSSVSPTNPTELPAPQRQPSAVNLGRKSSLTFHTAIHSDIPSIPTTQRFLSRSSTTTMPLSMSASSPPVSWAPFQPSPSLPSHHSWQ
eukprot:GGOE01044417.1.p1 GENE.GGOE01044417.1~~GGOE01044417.1.p1  ORF type:complete len:289 (+),score=49.21 GGOE01044417.1:24-869(+)